MQDCAVHAFFTITVRNIAPLEQWTNESMVLDVVEARGCYIQEKPSMLRLSRRLETRSAAHFGSHIRRNYQTNAKLNVFQEKGSFMCTRAAAATIMNNLKGSVWE